MILADAAPWYGRGVVQSVGIIVGGTKIKSERSARGFHFDPQRRLRKHAVWRGLTKKTAGGVAKAGLKKNKVGQIVSRAKSEIASKGLWPQATARANRQLNEEWISRGLEVGSGSC